MRLAETYPLKLEVDTRMQGDWDAQNYVQGPAAHDQNAKAP